MGPGVRGRRPAVIEWLAQRARPYIFTTAASPIMAAVLLASLDLIAAGDDRRTHLQELIACLRSRVRRLAVAFVAVRTAIQPLLVGDNEAAVRLSERLFERGLWVPAIRPPTVPVGTARLREPLPPRTMPVSLTPSFHDPLHDCADHPN